MEASWAIRESHGELPASKEAHTPSRHSPGDHGPEYRDQNQFGADGRTRTGKDVTTRRILSPLRLPFRHIGRWAENRYT